MFDNVVDGRVELPAAQGSGLRETRPITSRGEWLRWRREDITASRVAALFDCHPFMSRDDLAAELRGHSHGDNAAMRRGRILEPAVIEAVREERSEWILIKAGTYHRLVAHRLGATPDCWIGGEGLLQCKTVNPLKWEEWRGKPPLAYQLQTLTEMLVTNRSYGVLAIMVTSSAMPVHIFEIKRHDAAEQRILRAVDEWWQQWDAGKIAAPAPTDDLGFVFDDGSSIDLSADNMLPELLDERTKLKAENAEVENRLKIIDAEIKQKIGAARTAWLPGWQISLATIHRGEYVVPATDYRRLTIKRLEET